MPMSLPQELVENARREREEAALKPITSEIDRLVRQGMGGLEAVAGGVAETVAPFAQLLAGGDIQVPTLEDLTPDFLKRQYAPQPAPQPIMGGTTAPRSVGGGFGAPEPATGRPAAMPTGAGATAAASEPGPIDNSSREAFVRTSYPYALRAADGDPTLANQLVATAISENGKVGTGRDLGEMGFNVGGIQGVEGPAGSFTALDAGRPRQFAAYNDLSEGFRAVRDLVSGGRYAQAAANYRQTGDIDRYWREVNEAGYSETPDWQDRIASIRRSQVEPLTGNLPARPTGPQPTTPMQAEQTPAAQAQAGAGIDVADVAERYKGGSYVFGGGRDGQGGIPGAVNSDCSAFVSSVWREKGLPLVAHTDGAYNQLRQLGAPEVGVKDARPGDIVFYMGAGTGGAITHHMGIYAGDGKVLDQSVSGGEGVKTRDLGHAGRFVIIRDPRLNREPARTASVPPPIVPTGIAEQTGGEKLSRAEMARLSQTVEPLPSGLSTSLNTGDAQATPAPSPPVPAGASSPPAGTPPSPWEQAVGRPGDGGLLLKSENEPLMLPGDGGFAPEPPAPTIADPTITDPVYTTPPNLASFGPVEQAPEPLGPPAPVGAVAPAPPLSGSLENVLPSVWENVVKPVAATLDAANEWFMNHPILGQANPQAMGRELQGWDQIGAEMADDYRRLEALAARYHAGDASVLPEMQALQQSMNAKLERYAGREGRLEAGERNPDKRGELLGGVVQSAATLGIAPGLGAGVARNAVAAALDPVGQLVGGGLETVGRGIAAAPAALERAGEVVGPALRGVGQRVGEALMDANPVLTPRVIQESGGGSRQIKPTAEVLQEQLDWTRSVIDRARAAGDTDLERRAIDRAWEIESALVDARNARRDLEPAIASDVGRRIEDVPLDEGTADALTDAMRPRERVSPEDARDLGGPVGVPTNMAGRANAGLPFDPTGAMAGGAAGGLSEDEGGEAGDPLRTALGVGLGAFGGRVARVKPKIGATAERVAEETAAGARRGARMNDPLARRASAVPRSVQAATRLTDDRAAQRWAEDMLTDAAGSPRLPEMDPARPSTLSRINANGIAADRIDRELAPAVERAAGAGLQDELPQYLDDLHRRDILDDAYATAAEDVLAEWQPRIDGARTHGANPGTIARMEARAQAEADLAGNRAIKRAQDGGREGAYEAVDARVRAVEARAEAAGATDALAESAQGIWDHNRATVERLRDAGLITAEDADEILAKYPHGVPTTVVDRLLPTDALAPVPVTEAFTARGQRMNPIVASRIFTLQAERAIQKNAVMQAFGRLIDDAVDAGGLAPGGPSGARSLWGGGKPVTWLDGGRPVTVHLPQAVADGLEASANMGVNGHAVVGLWKRVAGFITSSITAGRASFLPVNMVRDLQDFAIRNATNEGGPQRLPAIVGTFMDEAGRAFADLAASNYNVRGVAGAGAGAFTGAAQGDEDTTLGERALNAVKGGVAGAVILGANKARITGNAADFLAKGGGSGAINPGVRASERWYREVLRDGGAVVRTPKDLADYLGDWLRDIASLQGVKAINERTELISRTATMRRSAARGLGETEAVIAGRDVTYDPDRAGTVVRAANGLVPFLNATVQSGAQAGRLFKRHPAAAALTLATTVGPAMLAFEAWNRSDAERAARYDDVPQSAKDSGLVLVLPGTSSDARGERPNYVVIPTGLATPAIVALREALREVPGLEPAAGRVGSDPEAGAAQRAFDVLSAAVQVFSPVKGDSSASIASNMVPPVVKQGVELGLNKDLYRGAPISSPSADERASAFSRTVAEGANEAGRMIGSDFLQEVTPSGVEYVVRQAPAYGDLITGASDMLSPSAAKQEEDRPVANQPFFGGVASRFVKDSGGANLTRAQDARLPDGARAVLEEAGLPPSTIGPVPSRYKGAMLTRDEQLLWQASTNSYMADELLAVQEKTAWDDPAKREQLVRDAMARAREKGAKDALGDVGSSERRERIEREQDRKAS